jgi:hypothetical protein
VSAHIPRVRRVDQHTGKVAKSLAQSLLDVCKCGHPAIQHTHEGEGWCQSCCCGPFSLDRHQYPLGLVVTS